MQSVGPVKTCCSLADVFKCAAKAAHQTAVHCIVLQVRWILSTCRGHIVELQPKEQIAGMHGVLLTSLLATVFLQLHWTHKAPFHSRLTACVSHACFCFAVHAGPTVQRLLCIEHFIQCKRAYQRKIVS